MVEQNCLPNSACVLIYPGVLYCCSVFLSVRQNLVWKARMQIFFFKFSDTTFLILYFHTFLLICHFSHLPVQEPSGVIFFSTLCRISEVKMIVIRKFWYVTGNSVIFLFLSQVILWSSHHCSLARFLHQAMCMLPWTAFLFVVIFLPLLFDKSQFSWILLTTATTIPSSFSDHVERFLKKLRQY